MGRSQVAVVLSRVVVMAAVWVQIGGLVGLSSGADGGGLAGQCTTQIQQLGNCLMFATGKAAEPTKECCTAISSMKDTKPVCLCFFIGQAHNGSQTIKSLGIQEAKLLQLPDACHLVNASVTNCPKLLGISPTSPAAAIFMNSNATSSPTSNSPSATTSNDSSSGFKHNNNGVLLLGSLIVTVFITIVHAVSMQVSF